MKTRLIASICLLAACLGAALFCVFHSRRCAKELSGSLEAALSAAAQKEGWPAATEEVLRLWERDKNFYHILLPHANLNELEWALGSLPEFLARQDRAMFIEQCVRGMQCVKTIREMEIPSWGNIF
ncbi:MAG: DUF4363 family protein [Oscillospiraceae bacterium]|jgi:hypothetical protein|nr:DUF4363 family protein [Oscillospiraceae bacterium]